MAAAKVMGDFAKQHQHPAVKAGWIDGQTVEPSYVNGLVEMPPGRSCSVSCSAA